MDNALGCLLGVAVGDSAGSPLEQAAFDHTVEPRLALAMMRMPGMNKVLGKGELLDFFNRSWARCRLRVHQLSSPSCC
jgi:hypothetical protein